MVPSLSAHHPTLNGFELPQSNERSTRHDGGTSNDSRMLCSGIPHVVEHPAGNDVPTAVEPRLPHGRAVGGGDDRLLVVRVGIEKYLVLVYVAVDCHPWALVVALRTLRVGLVDRLPPLAVEVEALLHPVVTWAIGISCGPDHSGNIGIG